MTMCANCNNCNFDITKQTGEVYSEIHVTVKYDPTFISFCEGVGIKVIHIELGKGIPDQLMTSITKVFATTEEYQTFVNYLQVLFQPFEILRFKVEVSPNHPAAQAATKDNGLYFESHLAVSNPDDMLKPFAKNLDLHPSRNLMKKGDNSVQMLTYRELTTYEDFLKKITSKSDALKALGYNVAKTIVEYCLYDSNVELDGNWLKS